MLASAAEADKTLTDADRVKLAADLKTKAVASLQMAQTLGYFAAKTNQDLLQGVEFAALRNRDDFKKLIAELEAK